MERDARLQARGVRIAGHVDQGATYREAIAAFRGARLLNPDTTADVGRAYVYWGAGRLPRAASILEDVVRREPSNLTAWAALFGTTRGRDPEAARRALAARTRLDPLSARPLPRP
jgi:hypothetical protein